MHRHRNVLFTDLDFLRLAPECLAALQSDQQSTLAGTLREAIASKRESLPGMIANATLASEEFSGLWRVPGTLGEFPASDSNAHRIELRYIASEVARWLSGDFRHDSARFEKALGALRKGEAGSLIAAAVLTQSELDSASRSVQLHRDAQRACINGTPGRPERDLQRVVGKHFVAEIQPWLVRVTALRRELLAPHRALERQLGDAQSPAYRRWREQRDIQLAWLSSASDRHEQTIRQTLACR